MLVVVFSGDHAVASDRGEEPRCPLSFSRIADEDPHADFLTNLPEPTAGTEVPPDRHWRRRRHWHWRWCQRQRACLTADGSASSKLFMVRGLDVLLYRRHHSNLPREL